MDYQKVLIIIITLGVLYFILDYGSKKAYLLRKVISWQNRIILPYVVLASIVGYLRFGFLGTNGKVLTVCLLGSILLFALSISWDRLNKSEVIAIKRNQICSWNYVYYLILQILLLFIVGLLVTASALVKM